MEMDICVGLGNPGGEYEGTRHNVGFEILDSLARENGLLFSASPWQASFVRASLWQVPLLLVKPETHMNLSGHAVAGFADYYEVPPARILIIHDDLDLPLGRMKIVASGGDGGHRGVRSIIDCLATTDFPRLKIGIGRPGSSEYTEQYVLSRMPPAEQLVIKEEMPIIVNGIKLFFARGCETAMNFVNGRR